MKIVYPIPESIMNKASKLILLFAFFYLSGCGDDVETTTPKKANVVESVYASGVVKSENQYEVYTKSVGVVENIFVKEGTAVKKGTPIFQLNNTTSALSSENARLYSLANDYRVNKEKLAEAENSIALAQKKLKNDSLLYVRQQELWRQNIGTKVELEQKELNFENAKVNLKKAQVAYQDINRQLKLVSEQSKNNLLIARASENDLIIRSEVDGFVYKINAKKGELATSMASLAVIGQEDFIIDLNVDEFDIVKVKKGQKVIVRLDSYQDRVFEAEVRFIYPMMNERTRTFKVEAVFIKKPQVLYPNLTLEANIVINEKNNVLTIPSACLLNDTSVMLENGQIKTIQVGLKDFRMAEVLSGIDESTKVRMPEK